MNDEKYNGWSNRETWVMNWWLTNDEKMADEIIRIVKRSIDIWDIEYGIKEYVKDLKELSTTKKTTSRTKFMFDHIGCIQEVNWEETAEAWK